LVYYLVEQVVERKMPMATVTGEIPSEVHAKLGAFATADKRLIGEVLADLIEQEERRRLFDEADIAYARLWTDSKALRAPTSTVARTTRGSNETRALRSPIKRGVAVASVTVKIPFDAHATLAEFATTQERPMGEILADLIERERRRLFLEGANADFARLRADPEAWADYQAEIRSMEGTLMDGLEDDPWIE
jgi:hypothetical protein